MERLDRAFGLTEAGAGSDASGTLRLATSGIRRPRSRIAFFLHDEVMLHVPTEDAAAATAIVVDAAGAATQLIFGPIPIEFSVATVTVNSYADAK